MTGNAWYITIIPKIDGIIPLAKNVHSVDVRDHSILYSTHTVHETSNRGEKDTHSR